ncbi:hypothetical protein C8R46DRAFT_1029710 [Mycena filopes]|nr:hypothetical protein C8R46DRAFT_1029710 [Mycena filopes]
MAGPFLTLVIYSTLTFLLFSSSEGRSLPLQPLQGQDIDSEGTNNVCKVQREKTQGFPLTRLRIGVNRNSCKSREGFFMWFTYTEAPRVKRLQLWYGYHLYPTSCLTIVQISYTADDLKENRAPERRPPNDLTVTYHVLELNILKDVMESAGGPCDQLAVLYKASKKADALSRVKLLTDIINGYSNLVYADAALEDQKTLVVAHTFGKAANGLTPVTYQATNTPNRLKAAHQYLAETNDMAQKVAQALDAQIQISFPGTTLKMVDEWNKVLLTANSLAVNGPPPLPANPPPPILPASPPPAT